jgi:hypothetical protein
MARARLDFVDMLRATSHDNYPPLQNLVLHYVIFRFRR